MKQNTPSTQKQENTAAEKKCIHCGKDVPVAAFVCPYCQRWLKCPVCDIELKVEYKVCPKGHPIPKRPLSQRIADLFKEVTKDENRLKLVVSLITGLTSTGLISRVISVITWDAVGLTIGTIIGVFVAIVTFKYLIQVARMAQMLIYGLLGGAIGGAIIGGVCWFISSPILGPIIGYPTGGFVGRILAVVALGSSIVIVEMFVERAKTAGRVVFVVVIGIIGWVVWEIMFSSVHEIVFSRMSLAEGSGWATIWVVINAIAGAIVGIIISMFIAIRSRQQQK